MIQPDRALYEQIARMGAQYPEFVLWLNEWRTRELDTLPVAAQNVVGVSQGRCQVLTELCKLVNTARDVSAQSRK